MIKLNHILVPVDFTPQSVLSLKDAVRLASHNRKAKVFLLHVLPPVRAIDFPGPLAKEMNKILERQVAGGKAKLDEWKKMVPSSTPCSVLLQRGKTVQAVIKTCREKSIDVVVLTTHGAQGLKRITRPNLSEAIVRLAPCPVLVGHVPFSGRGKRKSGGGRATKR